MTKLFLTLVSLTLVAACSSGPIIIPEGGSDRVSISVPAPEPERPEPEKPVKDKPITGPSGDKPKSNASGNNGKGGNYAWTGHTNNGKGKQ